MIQSLDSMEQTAAVAKLRRLLSLGTLTTDSRGELTGVSRKVGM